MILPASPESIAKAAEAILDGQLVVIPTETVYGLAADATNEAAIRRVFEAKGRPPENPLIVHIADMETLKLVAATLPPKGAALAARFWPGPLTLVLPKTDRVPSVVTGGLSTVAVRMPDHPVALALIRASGRPLAAPSANRFMRLSPTKAKDVDATLAGIVLDGGDCRIGLESTVVDLTSNHPRLLRPGGVSRAQIEACLGEPLLAPPIGPRKSPGQYARHYSPETPIEFVSQLKEDQAGLTFGKPSGLHQIQMPKDPAMYAARLYAALHSLDRKQYKTLFVQELPEGAEWEAVADRLRRAAGRG